MWLVRLSALQYAIDLNGINYLNINHLDSIGKFDKFKVCIAYLVNGKETKNFSTNEDFLKNATPIIKNLMVILETLVIVRKYEIYQLMQRSILNLLKTIQIAK